MSHATIATIRKMIRDEISDPDELATLFELIAEDCHESASELDAAWQDSSAGRPWSRAAKGLEQTAFNIREG